MTKAELIVKLYTEFERLEIEIGNMTFREQKIMRRAFAILREARDGVLEENNSTNIVAIAERDNRLSKIEMFDFDVVGDDSGDDEDGNN